MLVLEPLGKGSVSGHGQHLPVFSPGPPGRNKKNEFIRTLGTAEEIISNLMMGLKKLNKLKCKKIKE